MFPYGPYPHPVGSFVKPQTPPTSNPDSMPCVCITFNQDWLPYVLGALTQLQLQSTWDVSTEEEFTDIYQRASSLITLIATQGYDLMPCGCTDLPPNAMIRIAPDGTLQISTDGGVTWVDGTAYDPRANSMIYPLLPTGISDTTRCAAAGNVTANLQRLVNELVAGEEIAAEILATVVVFILEFLSVGVLTPLAVAVSGLIAAIGATALNAAFDSGTYDTIRCILYCNMDNQGVVSSFTQLLSDVDSQLNPVAAPFVHNLFAALGANGITNAGRIGGNPGDDCGGCGCGCTTLQFYSVTVDANWSGGTHGTDGGCGDGRFVGTGYGSATLHIPDRAGRLIAAVGIGVCDAAFASGPPRYTTVTIDGHASNEGTTLDLFGGENLHHFTVSQDSDDVVINVSSGYWMFITGINIYYDC